MLRNRVCGQRVGPEPEAIKDQRPLKRQTRAPDLTLDGAAGEHECSASITEGKASDRQAHLRLSDQRTVPCFTRLSKRTAHVPLAV